MDIMTEEFLVNLDVGQDMGLSQEGRGVSISILSIWEKHFTSRMREPQQYLHIL